MNQSVDDRFVDGVYETTVGDMLDEAEGMVRLLDVVDGMPIDKNTARSLDRNTPFVLGLQREDRSKVFKWNLQRRHFWIGMLTKVAQHGAALAQLASLQKAGSELAHDVNCQMSDIVDTLKSWVDPMENDSVPVFVEFIQACRVKIFKLDPSYGAPHASVMQHLDPFKYLHHARVTRLLEDMENDAREARKIAAAKKEAVKVASVAIAAAAAAEAAAVTGANVVADANAAAVMTVEEWRATRGISALILSSMPNSFFQDSPELRRVVDLLVDDYGFSVSGLPESSAFYTKVCKPNGVDRLRATLAAAGTIEAVNEHIRHLNRGKTPVGGGASKMPVAAMIVPTALSEKWWPSRPSKATMTHNRIYFRYTRRGEKGKVRCETTTVGTTTRWRPRLVCLECEEDLPVDGIDVHCERCKNALSTRDELMTRAAIGLCHIRVDGEAVYHSNNGIHTFLGERTMDAASDPLLRHLEATCEGLADGIEWLINRGFAIERLKTFQDQFWSGIASQTSTAVPDMLNLYCQRRRCRRTLRARRHAPSRHPRYHQPHPPLKRALARAIGNRF